MAEEELEGHRLFDIDEKMVSDNFPQCFVKEMKGEGEYFIQKRNKHDSPSTALKCCRLLFYHVMKTCNYPDAYRGVMRSEAVVLLSVCTRQVFFAISNRHHPAALSTDPRSDTTPIAVVFRV